MDHLCILESVQQHVNSLISHQESRGWYGLQLMVYHRVLSATSWLVTIRVWTDGGDNYVYHIISVEDITKSYEISWKENMNGKFPWYCIGHKICQHQWLININLSFFSWRFTLFLRSVYHDTLVSVYRYVSWPPNIGAPRCTGESRHPYRLCCARSSCSALLLKTNQSINNAHSSPFYLPVTGQIWLAWAQMPMHRR